MLEAVLGCKEEELSDCIESRQPVISVVGGGGKTTCIKAMASESKRKGIKAAVATTTHMQMPHDSFLLDTEEYSVFLEKMEREGQVWLGKRLDPNGNDPNMIRNKSRALSQSFVRRVCRDSGVPVYIEAAGAKCLPFKAPAAHEPVIIPETTIVLSVCGLDVLEGSFDDMVFRADLACSLLGKDPSCRVQPDDVVQLLLSPESGMKGVGDDMEYQVVLNKADDERRRSKALEIAGKLLDSGVSRVHITNALFQLMV